MISALLGSGRTEIYGDTSRGQTHNDQSPKKKSAKGSGVGSIFLILLFLVIAALIVFVVYRKRETIYEYAPAVRIMHVSWFIHVALVHDAE